MGDEGKEVAGADHAGPCELWEELRLLQGRSKRKNFAEGETEASVSPSAKFQVEAIEGS